ncbi:WD40-repeat-containing domain protein [Hygrophoropsis aurantiaca]|uniref:WD40-repeat-containing domain protein n=1 Tax=Hygrophoropsis aurantiaca TaxID=72124 RepID=A0ACB8ABQ1_9AGAM|nr:WD40-repeat-containing domain protein [Hygrophoropsis aurantiaca]
MPKVTSSKSAERKSKKARIENPTFGRQKPTPSLDITPPTPKSAKGKEKAKPAPQIPEISSSNLPTTFKVVAGSYEKLLYGLEGTVTCEGSDYQFHLNPIFIFPAHVSCIKAVAASPNGGKWLATGSADEIVKVWDLRRRKEIGGLMHHEGSITQLQFPSRSHLLSASEDGTLCLFRARDWAVLRSLKGHKDRINSVAVHPSGKVALSVGKDKTLRMWDLMRGKGSASTKLGKEGEVVRWSIKGSSFVVQSQSSIDVFSTDMVLRHTITHPSRIHNIRFCNRAHAAGEIMLVAAEDKKVSIYDIPEDHDTLPTIIAELVGHTNRVKAVEMLQIALPPSKNQTSESIKSSTTIACTVSSDGKIHIYDLAMLPAVNGDKVELLPVVEYDTKGTRLTCVTIAEGESTDTPANGKRKRGEDEDESEVEGEEEWVPHVEAEEEEEEEESEDDA